MVQRNEITGVDIDDDLTENLNYLSQNSHTRVPLYQENLDEIIGVIHVKRLMRLLKDPNEITRKDLEEIAEEPHFVPLSHIPERATAEFSADKKAPGLCG